VTSYVKLDMCFRSYNEQLVNSTGAKKLHTNPINSV